MVDFDSLTKDEKWLLDEKYAGEPSAEFEADKERLASGEPLAYVIGYQPFLGLKIYLDSHPLIPRAETEWWVEQMLANLGVQLPIGSWTPKLATRVLDLCAGSGAIGCAVLARAFGARVSFGEIDPKHEATILKNIRENHLDASPHSAKASRDKRADIRIGDLFEPFENERFDLIAINPPYIPSGRELDTSVTDYEPAGALYSGDDGLDLIRRIACELPRHLAQGGSAWIEVDSAHASAARDLFSDQGFTPEIMNDHYGVPRIIRI